MWGFCKYGDEPPGSVKYGEFIFVVTPCMLSNYYTNYCTYIKFIKFTH